MWMVPLFWGFFLRFIVLIIIEALLYIKFPKFLIMNKGKMRDSIFEEYHKCVEARDQEWHKKRRK